MRRFAIFLSFTLLAFTPARSADLIGPKFADEIFAAGLGGLPFAWQSDGRISGRENLTSEQNDRLTRVLSAHNPAAVPVPPITKRQALTWLLTIGKSDADVTAAIDTIPDQRARAQALIDWAYPDHPYQRSNPLFDQLAPLLGLTPQQMDAAFISASAM